MAQRTGQVAPNMRHISIAMLMAFSGGQSAFASDTKELDNVVVSANRIESNVDSLPATVTAVTHRTMDKRMPHDQAALFEDDPDVVVGRDLRRFGGSSINIRGLDNERVLQMVDGVRLPDFYAGGGPSNATTGSSHGPELDFLKRVEVIRGPSSSLYGSDGLGGTVAYVTLDPKDILGGRSVAGRYKGTFRGADESFQNTAYFAAGNDVVEALVATTHRAGQELANRGDVGGKSVGRELANPQTNHSAGTLAKLIVKPTKDHKIALSYEDRYQDSDGEYLRLSASLPKVTGSRGNESTDRQRFGLDWEWLANSQWFDRMSLKAYQQTADNRVKTWQDRTNTSASCSGTSGSGKNCLVDMNFFLDQKSQGLGVQFDKGLSLLGHDHFVIAGVDWREHKIEQLRDYNVYKLTDGGMTKSLAGDTYPLRDFAPGKDEHLGVFVQDEIKITPTWTLTPGVRLDTVRLRPDSFSKVVGATTLQAQNQDHTAISPKLAVQWKTTPDLTLYGQIARGFRAPRYTEVNGIFYNAAQQYATMPNGDLKPETSTSVEIGAKAKVAATDLKVALYDNRYNDFISQEVVCSTPTGNPAACMGGVARTAYQNLNLDKVHIRGAELRASSPLGQGWALAGAFAYTEGTVEGGKSLNSIEPMRLMLNLGWQGTLKGEQVGGDVRLRAASKKSGIDTTDVKYYRPDAYAVLDLGTWWQINQKARINVAVNNLFDEKYWLWSDVRQASLATTDPGAAFYSQPGRNVSASLQVDF